MILNQQIGTVKRLTKRFILIPWLPLVFPVPINDMTDGTMEDMELSLIPIFFEFMVFTAYTGICSCFLYLHIFLQIRIHFSFSILGGILR